MEGNNQNQNFASNNRMKSFQKEKSVDLPKEESL
jgi:hypothetical protein